MKKKKITSEEKIKTGDLPQISLNQPLKIEEELKDKEISLKKKDQQIFFLGIFFTSLIFLLTLAVFFLYFFNK